MSIARHGQRDARYTRFACTRCGAAGRATHDKPSEGFQLDTGEGAAGGAPR